MHVTIIDSIYLSRIRNYIVGYQNVACGGCVEGLERVAWGFAGCLGVRWVWLRGESVGWVWLRGESVTAGVFGALGVRVGCRLGMNRTRLRAANVKLTKFMTKTGPETCQN